MITHAPERYDRTLWQAILEELRRRLDAGFARGQDVRLQQGERLILKSPNGTLFAVKVDNAGSVGTSPL